MVIRAKLSDEKLVYRDIAIDPNISLYSLADAVLSSFGFNFDHCFGFYNSPDIYGKGKDQVHYELFYDIGEEVEELAESVEKTLVAEVIKINKQKIWMLFDHGEDWVFELECKDNQTMDAKNGTILKSSGESPKQYC